MGVEWPMSGATAAVNERIGTKIIRTKKGAKEK